jgi:hypothetical protein
VNRIARHAVPLLLAALGCWLLVNVGQTVGRIRDFYTPLPVRDYWRCVIYLPDYQAFHLGVLWRQHNEHRIVFPELIFASDMLLGHGLMLIPLSVSFICYTVTWLGLSSVVLLDAGISLSERWLAGLLAGVFALFESVAIVLAVPFLLQWTLTQCAVTFSLVCLSLLAGKESARMLTATISAAVIATYSSANGLVLWPLLLTFAVLLRVSKRSLAILLAAAVLSIGLYFAGYRFSNDLHVSQLIVHPLYTLGFVCSYLSLPFGAVKAPTFGISVGVLSLLTAVLCLGVMAKRNLLSSRASVVLLGYYAFTLLTALLTAAARIDPSDTSFYAAKGFRYISLPQMNWAGLILLVFWLLARIRKTQVLTISALALSLAFLVASVKLGRWLPAAGSFFTSQQAVVRRLEAGHFDRELVSHYVFPDLRIVQSGLADLKASKLSIYYQPAPH